MTTGRLTTGAAGAAVGTLAAPLLLRTTAPTPAELVAAGALAALAVAAGAFRRRRDGATPAEVASPDVAADLPHAIQQGVPRENVAALAHELRTPLAAAVGHLDLVAGDERVAREHRSSVESAIASMQRASSLLGDFLADPEAWLPDGAVRDPQPVDLHTVVHDALGDFAPLAALRQVSISFDSVEAAVVAGDARRLRQAVDNLVSNAVKYAEQGGWVDVRLALEGDPTVASLELTNPGTTLDDDEAARVFDVDFRGTGATSRAEGHGIGLAVTRRIVAAHDGDVTLTSSRTTGTTTARVTLPALLVEDQTSPCG